MNRRIVVTTGATRMSPANRTPARYIYSDPGPSGNPAPSYILWPIWNTVSIMPYPHPVPGKDDRLFKNKFLYLAVNPSSRSVALDPITPQPQGPMNTPALACIP